MPGTTEIGLSSDLKQQNVRVSRFSPCRCSASYYDEDHLSIQTFDVDLSLGEAAAISYAIDDFDRQYHVFGRRDHDVGQPIRLLFGGEWVISDLRSSLVKLSKDHKGLWVDQLSIPQTPKEIQIRLQQMPEIYHTFEVVVLLPNAPCTCLAQAVASYEAGEQRLMHSSGDFNRGIIERACLNSVPVSSHQFRLWTKQEFSYALYISLHYCSGQAGPCSKGLFDWSATTRKLSLAQQS
jgi:Heterokaryon incompatibility protein (HET)